MSRAKYINFICNQDAFEAIPNMNARLERFEAEQYVQALLSNIDQRACGSQAVEGDASYGFDTDTLSLADIRALKESRKAQMKRAKEEYAARKKRLAHA